MLLNNLRLIVFLTTMLILTYFGTKFVYLKVLENFKFNYYGKINYNSFCFPVF